MVVTFEGIAADVSDVQFWKQAREMVVNEGFVGNTTLASEVQPSKALFCIVATDGGQDKDPSEVHPTKQ